MATITAQGRQLTDADLQEIQTLIDQHPDWSRRRIADHLVRQWDWRNKTGRLKDMSCRLLLARLGEKDLLRLPARRCVPGRRKSRVIPPLTGVDTTQIACPLSELRPVSLEVVAYKSDQALLFDGLLAEHHYLGYTYPIGANVRYLIRDRQQRLLACAVWSSAALKVSSRDKWIGWSPKQRIDRLGRLANNTRFCVLPWVHVPHLASHLLAMMARQLRHDWQTATGERLALLETFVDADRFRGTCYSAANWLDVGRTVGRTRNDRYNTITVPVKQVRLYPLMPTPRLRAELTA